jgi:hypothetical protein
LDIVRVDRDLVVSPDEVDLGKNGVAGRVLGVVMVVADGVAVWDGAGVQGTVVPTRPPTAVLRHQMEGPLRGVMYRPSAWR